MPLPPMKKIKVPKRSEKTELPTKPDEWVTYVNAMHDQGIGIREKFEHQWIVNLAYYLGLQKMIFHPSTGEFEVDQSQDDLMINRIASFIESRHAKITKVRPVPRVIPNTSDLEDQRAAKWSDRALMHLWRKIDLSRELDLQTIMMLLYGVSFVKTIWDPMGGEAMKVTKQDQGIIEASEDGEIEEENIFMGEVCSKALSPFQVLVSDDSVASMKDQEWIMERMHKSVAEIETMYPHLKGKVKLQDVDQAFTNRERTLRKLQSSRFAGRGFDKLKKRDTINSEVLVKTFWMRPNSAYEKGVVCVVIGDQLAMLDKWPNDYGDNVYPIARFSERETGSHFWTQSTIERLIPVQRAYNALSTQKLKNARVMVNGKYLLAKGSQVSEDSLTDEEGEVIEYNPSVPAPSQMAIAPLPNYFNELRRELVGDLRDVGGQRESAVTPPPGVTAATALTVLAEQEDEILNPIIRRRAGALTLMAQTQLMLINQEWEDKRRVKVFGDGGPTGVEFMSRLDLKNHTDVHFEVESLFPEFRGAKQQRVMDLWDRRIIQDPAQFLEAFRFGNLDGIMETLEKKQERVHFIIEDIKNGKQPEITPFDDSGKIILGLTNFAATPEFQRLEPDRKQLLFNVATVLMQKIAAQVASQAAQTQQNQGAVSTPSGTQRPVGA